MNISADHCIVFEDSMKGIHAAHLANMYTVGIGNPKDLNLADLVIPDFISINPNDIIQWFMLNKNSSNIQF